MGYDANAFPVIEGNVLATPEKEIALGVSPTDFAKKAPLTITVEQATSILKKMGIKMPTNITISNLTNTVNNLPKMTDKQINLFIKEARKLAEKK